MLTIVGQASATRNKAREVRLVNVLASFPGKSGKSDAFPIRGVVA